MASIYRGRFAPTPSGPLHFGSLIAATGSYLQARAQRGEWWLRIDDIDPPREQKGAVSSILSTLEEFGFEWDGEVLYQSKRQQRYQQVVEQLKGKGLAYACSCSRSSIQKKTGQKKGELVYPGFCREQPLQQCEDYSIRLRVDDGIIRFEDTIQGTICTNLAARFGDFVIQRRDGYFAYHLATGIDDAEQGITEVVRGADLLDSTPCQMLIQHQLGLPCPSYAHLPIACNHSGQKLSKQSHAPALDSSKATILLQKSLKFLGQMPPISLADATLDELWQWAIENWDINRVPAQVALE